MDHLTKEEIKTRYLEVQTTWVAGHMAGQIMSFGTAPFCPGSNNTIIPHGFMMKSRYLGNDIVGETRVEAFEETSMTVYVLHYRFCRGTTRGEFLPNPSQALTSLMHLLRVDNPDIPRTGHNGARRLGVHLPLVQSILRAYHSPPPMEEEEA